MPAPKHIRILFFSDTHLGFDYPIRPRIERRRRGEDFFANFQRILDFARKEKPDLLIHGGDLFFRARIPHPIVDRVYAMLLDFAKNGIPLYLIPGNHEYSRFPGLFRLSNPNLHVFTRSRTFLQSIKGVTIALAGFPYERRNIRQNFKDRLVECRVPIASTDIRLLCLHHAVEGARVEHYTFRNGEDVIRGDEIPGGFQAILSGHIHRQQILHFRTESGAVPVIYCGSIERTSVAERNEDKGFYLLDFKQASSGKWMLEPPHFKKLPTRPMVDLMLDVDQLTPETLAPYLRQNLAQIDKNAIVRLTCRHFPGEWLTEHLTAQFLREITPKTMNLSLSSKFFPGRKFYRPDRDNAQPGQIRMDLY